MVLTSLPTPSLPQEVPHITIDGSLQSLDGSGVNAGRQSFSNLDVEITREMGLLRESNLFHSFSDFNVPDGGSVTFTGPSFVDNILSRVTGAHASNINGTLASTIDGANLFLMNPQGILFGPNASLDISGSFYATTANNIELADGELFNTIPGPDDSLLTSAPPEAFGFFGENPGVISVDQSALLVNQKTLEVNSGETISFTGGEINLKGAPAIPGPFHFPPVIVDLQQIPTLKSPGGTILITSVNGKGKVDVSTAIPRSDTPLGTVTLGQDTQLTARGAPTFQNGAGGNIIIRNNRLVVLGAEINTSNVGTGESGEVRLESSQDASLLDSELNVSNLVGAGAGGITISAGQSISLDSTLISATQTNSTAKGKFVNLKAKDIEIKSGKQANGAGLAFAIDTSASGDAEGFANGVDILLEGDSIRINNGASIFSLGGSQGGGFVAGGNITLNGEEFVTIEGIGSGLTGTASGIIANSNGLGSGNIEVNTKQLILSEGGTLQNFVSDGSLGNAGVTTINASEEVLISGNSFNQFGTKFSSSLVSSTNNSAIGNAGDITINTPTLTIKDGGVVRNNTSSKGNGGQFIVNATDILITGSGTEVSTATSNLGQGGLTSFVANNITINEGAKVLNNATSGGDGGTISFLASRATEISGPSTEVSAGTSDVGNAGTIIFEGSGNVMIENGALVEGRTTGKGQGGNILGTIGGSFFLSDSATSLTTGAADQGRGGSINIVAGGDIVLTNFSNSLVADSTGGGGSGDITLHATESILINNSTISTSATQGVGGNIVLQAGEDIRSTNNSTVTAQSSGLGNAGDVNFMSTGGNLRFINSFVTTEAPNADGGNHEYRASGTEAVILFSNSTLSASVGGGSGGNINVDPGYIVINTSNILGTAASGQGGNVSLTADFGIFLDDFSILDVRSGTGDPLLNGSINVRAPIQQLKGLITPLPEDIVKVGSLYSQNCVAQKSGKFSSMVMKTKDMPSFQLGNFLASPLLTKDYGRKLSLIGERKENLRMNIHQVDFDPLVVGCSE